MRYRTMWRVFRCWTPAVAVGALLVAGCSDSTDPAGTGHVQVVLKDSGASSGILASLSASETSEGAPVTLDDVVSIDVVVAQVQALRIGGGGPGGPWVTLEVEDGGAIDLLDLGSAGIELAAGEVPAGTYTNVRLFVDDAIITFNRLVTVGEHEYAADTPYDVTIPSGEQTGIKTVQVSFTVPENGSETVELEFEAGTTVQNLAVTGTGAILMNPVLRQEGS